MLLIQNKGEAPVESYTLLGASLSRGKKGLIGQFGSGAKLAICTLLRAGLSITVYSGKTSMKFRVKTICFGAGSQAKQEQQVYVQFGGTTTKKQDLGWTLGFGELDWTDTKMALRELVANAIDQTNYQEESIGKGKDKDGLFIGISNNAKRARSGYTRVYVDVDDDVEDYINNLPIYFLHFSNVDVSQNILPKVFARSQARIYYNGVYVRELKSTPPSLYDYNFTEGEVHIDETRNMNDYLVRYGIEKLYKKAGMEDVKNLVTACTSGDKWLETDLDYSFLSYSKYLDSEKATEQENMWNEAWSAVHGSAYACHSSEDFLYDYATKKGLKVAKIFNKGIYKLIGECGIPTVLNTLDNYVKNGMIKKPVPKMVREVYDEVWEWVTTAGFNSVKPALECFDALPRANMQELGLCDMENDIISIKYDLEGRALYETVLHEIGHAVSNSKDLSHDFTAFFIKLMVRWMRD